MIHLARYSEIQYGGEGQGKGGGGAGGCLGACKGGGGGYQVKSYMALKEGIPAYIMHSKTQTVTRIFKRSYIPSPPGHKGW